MKLINSSLYQQCIDITSRAFVLFILLASTGCADTFDFGLSSNGKYDNVSVRFENTSTTSQRQSLATQGVLGMNNLYWIDDDLAWNQQGLGQKLQQLGIGALRYPGGEVADNYDWETNSLERPDQFPKEAPNSNLKAQRLDYLEFLQHAKQINANNLFFVVNLEGAFISPGNREENILRYAKKAARWVSEVKRQGYSVKYWEVGNESYIAGTAYPLTALEYAQALNVFYKEMKLADPTIKIGALGPDSIIKTGFADGLTAEQLNYLRQAPEGNSETACRRQNKRGKKCGDLIRKAVNGGEKTKNPWWNIVLANAKYSFDFAAIHNYGWEKNPLKQTETVQTLRSYLQENTGRPIEVAVTEWNVPPTKRQAMSAEDMALNIAIKLGNYSAGGVSHALFWPMRSPQQDQRALLSFNNSDITTIYKTLAIVYPALQGVVINQQILNKHIYFLQTETIQGSTAGIFVNTDETGKTINSNLNANAEIQQFDALTGNTMITSGNASNFKLLPKSITVIKTNTAQNY